MASDFEARAHRPQKPSTFVRFTLLQHPLTSRPMSTYEWRCVMSRVRLFVALGLILVGAFVVVAKSKEEKQAEARKKADATLHRLYKAQPSAQAAIKKAAGYAVF